MTSVIDMIGGKPSDVARELKEFSESAMAFSSDRENLIDTFPKQWVGVVKGGVVASGNSSEDVLTQIKSEGIDPSGVIVRFLDRDSKTLIL